MNLRQKGYHRDNEILHAIEKYRALNTDQVRVLLFSDIKAGQRKAQDRLNKLHERKRLKRYESTKPYIYYREEWKQLKHLVGVNWIRLWFELCQPSWRKFKSWDYEQTYPMLRADGYSYTINTFTKENEFCFAEMDRATNEFDKVPKYCELYSKGVYLKQWWVKLAKRFPKVFIVTVSPSRADRIKEIIENEKTEDIRFEVRLLEDVKREVLATCRH